MSTNETDERAELLAAMRAKRRKNVVWLVGAAFLAVGLWVASSRVAARGSATDGEPAVARLTAVRDGRCWVGVRHSRCYHLDFEVLPARGAPFPADVDVNIEDRFASRLQVGSRLRVFRDRNDPHKVFVDTQALGQPLP